VVTASCTIAGVFVVARELREDGGDGDRPATQAARREHREARARQRRDDPGLDVAQARPRLVTTSEKTEDIRPRNASGVTVLLMTERRRR